MIQEELVKVRKSHPEMTSELVKVIQYSNLILGQELNFNAVGTLPDIRSKHNLFQTIKELFYFNDVQHFNSKCSIDGDLHQDLI